MLKLYFEYSPFNDYSGDYSGSTLKIFVTGEEANATAKINYSELCCR